MITSHETEEDFYYMYHGLHIQCEMMELEWCPSFLMQDAQQSSYNAILNIKLIKKKKNLNIKVREEEEN